MINTAAIILAAGASTRMGQPKQLLEIGSRSLLHRTIDAAEAAGCGPIVVVLGAAFEAIEPTISHRAVTISHNVDWSLGMGTSIRAGIACVAPVATAQRSFLLLADQPHVDANLLLQLDAEQRRSGRRACVCEFANTLGPPVLVTRACFDQLAMLSPHAGAKEMWRCDQASIAKVQCELAAHDIDTPQDWARMRESP